MTSATPSSNASFNGNIVGLDIGTSSVRSLLFDSQFRHFPDLGAQNKYEITTTPEGGAEIDPDFLLDLTFRCLDELHSEMQTRGMKAAAVATSAFWHSFLGVDEAGRPTTPIMHLFDTRARDQVEQMGHELDQESTRQRTGCMFHTSYWPAKLLWLRANRAEAFQRTRRWISFGAYLLQVLFGEAVESTSMVSASGLWKQRENTYDEELLRYMGIAEEQLAPAETLDQIACELKPECAKRWPLFSGIPWCPAYGDGACNSIGSGCTTTERFALMVGTSGAMRVVVPGQNIEIPKGLWCYRVNRHRFILGGALSNGGEVFRWVSQTFRLPDDAEEEITNREPGIHGLTILPFLSGERSPYWRPELRGVITGLSAATTPTDILQAALEGVSLRFKQIYGLFLQAFPAPKQVVASGGALLASKPWRQMMANALGRPIVECLEPEASSRGAALIAAEQLGLIGAFEQVPVELGPEIQIDRGNAEKFDRLLERDLELFQRVFD